MAAMSFSSVLLPAPLCPVRKTISPGFTWKLASTKASRPVA
jgi:hypothetical protein